MATYPTSHADVRAALLAYTPHPSVAAAIEDAQAATSNVVAMVKVLDALRDKIGQLEAPTEGADPTPVMTEDGLKLLAGCAYMISENGFHGKGPEALPALLASVAALDALAA